MTSTADTTQHPDVSEISDLTEGLLAPSRSAAVRRHLDGCPLCADVRTSLEEIRGLLGTLPGPPRMPAEIAGRIDAALAAEALLSATAPSAPATDAHVSRETPRVRPATVTARTSGAGRPTDRPGDRPLGGSTAATGPGRPRRTRRRRVAALGAVLGAAALGLTLLLLPASPLTTGAAESHADRLADSGVTAAGTGGEFDGAPVANSVRTLLQQNSTFRAPKDTRAPESLSAEGGTAPGKRSLTAAPPACVTAATQRTEPVLAFRQGDYQGRSAYLVVLPAPADATRVDAYVVDASCASDGGKNPGDVLLRETVPRS
ncbi:zf-HC2 domain-containing protein [Streptomyces sp. NPDC090025]|uniref:zf-HC2 domain-containing protein n=1 Tax=Streptomyces sp. NPDC090025 TaxID=3365922 RepID=UPI0038360E46